MDERGSSSLLQLMTGAAVFVGIVALLFMNVVQKADSLQGTAATIRDRDSNSLADLLVGSVGIGWGNGADAVSRLGLSNANGTGLDAAHIQALQAASLTGSYSNGRIDYPDARAGLGLTGTQDFHLRLRIPTSSGTGSQGAVPLFSIRTAYVGDWTSVPTSQQTAPWVLEAPTSTLVSRALTALDATMGPNTATERTMLQAMGLDFINSMYVGPSPNPYVIVDKPSGQDPQLLTYLNQPSIDGDVYPDDKQFIDANLPGRLSNYDLLIIGSGVDQSTLTGNNVKNGIATWVNGGGRLMVMGSDSQNYQWLQPLFQSSVASVSGPVVAETPTPSALTAPYLLAWTTYDTHGLAWDIKSSGGGSHWADFDHLVTQGTCGTNPCDVLAVSKSNGAFGNGYIVLSSFRPRELSQDEANHLMINLIQYKGSVQIQDMDYGPTIPTNEQVSASVRYTFAWDQFVGQVPVTVTVYTWGG